MTPADADPPLAPLMSRTERLVLVATIAGRRHLVEYGCGGSTVTALASGIARITSVESDPAWCDRLRARTDVATAIAAGRLTLRHVDIGPVGAWGHPLDMSGAMRWPDYALAVWRDCPDGADSVDAVLIDGRFRVACILAALRQVRPGTPLIVHDFWDRPEYAPVLSLVLPVLRADSMAILVARQPADPAAIAALAKAAEHDPR